MSDKIKVITGKKIHIKNENLLVSDLDNYCCTNVILEGACIENLSLLTTLSEFKITQYIFDINYKNTNIKLIKKNNYTAICLDNLNLDSSEILQNLPKSNFLCINMHRVIDDIAKSLKGKMSNLPFSLEKVYLLYDIFENEYIDDKINSIVRRDGFNLLYNIKIPLNCDIIVKFGKNNYKITHIDENTFTLKGSSHTIFNLTNIKVNPRIFLNMDGSFFQSTNWLGYEITHVSEYMCKFMNNLCGISEDNIDKKISKKLLYSSNKHQNKKKY